MRPMIWQARISRRRFLQASGLTLVAVACGGNGGEIPMPGAADDAPDVEFLEPSTQLSGDLRILLWSHFVPRHDEWFDAFAKEWGQEVGVNVTVDHIDTADVVARISSEISAGSGHDLMQHISPIPQFEPSVVDLTDVTEEAGRQYGDQVKLCRLSSHNPTTDKFFAYSHGWVPDPGDYRKSLWEGVGLPDGPSTWDELLEGGAEIMSQQGIQMGIGMSQEVDSNMAGRALLWSFGAAVQDEDENVIINSPEAVDAVEFMAKLFDQSMTQEVFGWTAASNNELLIAGQASYILNSISAYRTAQQANPEVADDVFFVPALEGPSDDLVAQHVMYNWIVPEFSPNVDAAKEFLLNYTHNQARATWESELYDFPGFPERVPELSDWLNDDPFGSDPPDKLAVLDGAEEWSTNVGFRGPASAAIGEVFATFLIPNMFAAAARGGSSPQEAVAEAEAQIVPIFDKWRREGLIGG
ncbi:MAG TPA: extracellular solute-binding protein [Actinomycetota bacterium]|jgi:multiple sugar transport system substrate-binding protein|nr:extracellular solute-binding protein [Actinomycetota bacterium]